MNIDGARLNVDIRTPDRVEQLFAREHAAGVLDEIIQQAEFGRPEMNFDIVASDAMGRAVNADVADPDTVLCQGGPDAAHDSADACGELRHRERLGHVIVRAGVETTDPVRLLSLGGEHDDRQVSRGGASAQAAADLDAGQLRQHPVEQQNIRLALVDHHQRLLAVRGGGDLVAFLVEVVADQLDQRRLVLH